MYYHELIPTFCVLLEKGRQWSHPRRKKNHFKACVEGLFYKNIDDPSMITITTNVSVKAYSYLSIIKQNYGFRPILKLKERGNLDICSNISTRQEHKNLKHSYAKE